MKNGKKKLRKVKRNYIVCCGGVLRTLILTPVSSLNNKLNFIVAEFN